MSSKSYPQLNKTWRKVKLREVSQNFDSKRVPLSSMQRAKMRGEYPYYGAAEIVDYINDYIFDGLYLLIAEDGTVTMNGNKPMLQLVNGKFWVNNHAHVICGRNDWETKYLFYVLRDIPITPYITGAVQLKLTQENLNRVEIPYPEDTNIRYKIASILSAFDEKIEVNNKINQNLEQMAQAIFKEWFVKFRFPGWEKTEFVDSELGKIPKGWEIKNFEDMMDFLNGEYIPQSKYDSRGEYLIYGSNTIMGRSNKYLYKGPIIILAKIGSYCGAIRYSHLPCWVNNNAGGIRGKKEVPTSFIYYLLRRFNFNQVKEGTGQPFISMKGLKIQKAILPPQKLLDLFNKNIDSIKNYIAKNEKENQKLVSLRDLLLPKLMSGEIRV